MSKREVIVRAFGGRPLRRVAHEVANGRVYVSSERAIRLVEAGEMSAVGFPVEDTYLFDGPVFDRLNDAWNAARSTDPADWRLLTPFSDAVLVSC